MSENDTDKTEAHSGSACGGLLYGSGAAQMFERERRGRILSEERCKKVIAQMQQELEPFTNIILCVRMLERPVYLLTLDRTLPIKKIDDGLSERDKEIIKQAEEAMDVIRRKYSAEYLYASI